MGFRAFDSKVTRQVTVIAHGIVSAVTSKMTGLPALVAGFLVSAISCEVTLLVTVVAESKVTRREVASRAVFSLVSGNTAAVTNAFVGAAIRHVTWFTAVPTQRLRGAF